MINSDLKVAYFTNMDGFSLQQILKQLLGNSIM